MGHNGCEGGYGLQPDAVRPDDRRSKQRSRDDVLAGHPVMRRTSLGAASGLSLCALIGGIAGASAEERLVQGMGRTLGWVVADESGALKFRDCRGRLIEARDGKVERATGRCPGPGRKLEIQGVIKTLDREKRVLVIEAGSGTPRGFYLADTAAGGAHWTELEAGQPVRVSGPAEGRATHVAPL